MKPEKHWLNRTQMAKALGISPQAFSAWGVEPVAKVGRETFYLVGDVLANREALWIARAPESRNQSEEERRVAYQLARTRLISEQADAQAMKNEMLRHEVAPFGLFSFVLGKAANVVSGVMDALPVELMRRLGLKPQDVDKVRAMTSAACNEIAALGNEAWVSERFDEYLK